MSGFLKRSVDVIYLIVCKIIYWLAAVLVILNELMKGR